MKTKSILVFFLAVLCVITSCGRMENSNTAQAIDSTNMASILAVDDCFEKKMELWFARFNQFQNEGLDMEKAHHQAIASVANEFRHCNGAPDAFPGKRE
jgi:hypothetical protein